MTVPPSSSSAKPALWPFACALYEAPGVSEAAIMLQDRYLVDVNIMLFVCWLAGFEGGLMEEADIEAAVNATRLLQEGTIRPLRAERRAIPKGGEREAERKILLDLELEAEKAELSMLEGLHRQSGDHPENRAAIEAAATANLRVYFAHQRIDLEIDAAVALAHLTRSAADTHVSARAA